MSNLSDPIEMGGILYDRFCEEQDCENESGDLPSWEELLEDQDKQKEAAAWQGVGAMAISLIRAHLPSADDDDEDDFSHREAAILATGGYIEVDQALPVSGQEVLAYYEGVNSPRLCRYHRGEFFPVTPTDGTLVATHWSPTPVQAQDAASVEPEPEQVKKGPGPVPFDGKPARTTGAKATRTAKRKATKGW